MTNGAKNRPHDDGKNRPQDRSKNRPDIIIPISLSGVVDLGPLRGLLVSKRQTAWASQVRLLGLLLLIDYICRNLKKGSISISADLAHQYVSKLRKKDSPTTVTEPLLVLVKIGILCRVRPAVHAHIKASAVYRFADPYAKKQLQIKVTLTPKLAQKRASAFVRRDKGLNLRFPWREKLLADLGTISFSDSARQIIARGYSSKGRENLTRLVCAVDVQDHFVKVSERGQITTSIGSCPRGLLRICCSTASRLFPATSRTRIGPSCRLSWRTVYDHVSGEPGREGYVKDGWREHNRLVALLGDGDFYRIWCVDPQNDDERDEKKTILNILLNSKNEPCRKNVLYQRVRASFPITFHTIQDIKRKDHRNLSKQLHRFTADTVEAALLEIQREGIAAIPHVDALICQEKDRFRSARLWVNKFSQRLAFAPQSRVSATRR